jgi:hypothetical protein
MRVFAEIVFKRPVSGAVVGAHLSCGGWCSLGRAVGGADLGCAVRWLVLAGVVRFARVIALAPPTGGPRQAGLCEQTGTGALRVGDALSLLFENNLRRISLSSHRDVCHMML